MSLLSGRTDQPYFNNADPELPVWNNVYALNPF